MARASHKRSSQATQSAPARRVIAAESAALDALERGLIPADRAARPRRPNPMTDRDVARIGPVG